MRLFQRFLLAALTLAPFGAFAQSVQQSGKITINQVPVWISNGVIGGGVTAADSPVTSFGVTSNTTAGICVSSGRQSAAGRQQLCLGAPLSSAAVISLQNYGSAAAQDLSFIINGTTITIPTGGGSTIPTITTPLVSGDYICASGTAGVLADCTWRQTVGSANQIPYWTSATVMGNISAAASSVLITSAGSVPSLSQTLPSAVQGNITATGALASGSLASGFTVVTVPIGGTGSASFTANGVVISGTSTTSALTAVATASVGLCLLSNGGSAPSWGGCAGGAGSAAGSNTQVQFNNASALAGSANLTWVSPALTVGVNATATGQLVLANGGALGVSVTVQNPSATSAYNFNLPTGAGTSGQPLLSGGGGSTAMSFGTLGTAAGGTNCAVASGTCLDNITGFSSTGFMNRTGSGTYSFSPQVGLANGGTAANLTASNGGIVYSSATALAILSGTATANQIVMSGSSTTPAWSTATYPATTTVSQLLYSSSANTIAGLTTGNNGVLITSAGGVPSISSTIPSATQDNITRLGTITSGVWTGTDIALADGGTNASLVASNGGIFYSTASAGAILSGTATANQPLLSGSSTTPSWSGISYPASATSGGIPYFSSTSAMASSGALGSGQVVLGGGAGSTPTSANLSSILTAGAGIAVTGTTSVAVASSRVQNAQTGTTYTVLNSDNGKLVTFSNGSSIAVTLPQAGASSEFLSGWNADFINIGAGTVTITPTTSTINGGASYVLTTGQGVTVFSNGTNYFANAGAAVGAGAGTVTSVVCAATTITSSGTCYAAGQVVGTATNDNASAGNFGEYTSSNVLTGSAVSLTSGADANMTSVSLTAGDWNCRCVTRWTGAAGTTVQYQRASLSTTSATADATLGRMFDYFLNSAAVYAIIDPLNQPGPETRFSVSGTTTLYCVAQSGFGVSTQAVYGNLACRRAR